MSYMGIMLLMVGSRLVVGGSSMVHGGRRVVRSGLVVRGSRGRVVGSGLVVSWESRPYFLTEVLLNIFQALEIY